MRECKARGALSGRIYIALFFTIFLFSSFNVFIGRKGISVANGPHQIKKGYKTSPTADAAQQITSAKESKAQESSASEEADVAPTGDGDDATAADTSSSSANANTSNTKANPPAQAQAPKEKPPQRTPEATVLIKNIPDRTKEPEIRAMFQPYATKMNQKILGITLLANRGFCFVDFDSKNVVEEVVKDVAACKKDGKPNKFMINGKKLDVARKVPMDNKGGRGRGFRSASPGNGNFKHRGGRRPSPRGGNRSGAGKK